MIWADVLAGENAARFVLVRIGLFGLTSKPCPRNNIPVVAIRIPLPFLTQTLPRSSTARACHGHLELPGR